LNYFNGSEKELRVWCGLEVEETPITEIDFETMVRMLWQAHPELHKEGAKK